MNALKHRNKVSDLASVIKEMPEHHIEIPIKHYFAPGIYMREMTMPKNAIVVGKIHKTEHLCVLSKGSVSVVNGDDKTLYTAPCVIHSMPGTQRALFAHEDTVWINVHHNPDNEKNLEKIEEIFVVDTLDQFLSFQENKQIEGGK